MERTALVLRARTGLEWAVYILFTYAFFHGLITGELTFWGRSASFTVTRMANPMWFWSLMAFSFMCVVGLAMSVRKWWRNRGRWFPE